MRIAHQFGRPDVDSFLDQITPDEFVEWQEYFSVEPSGWRATNLMTARLAWATFQANAGKAKLNESDYAIRLRGPTSDAVERAILEASTVKQNMAADHQEGGT